MLILAVADAQNGERLRQMMRESGLEAALASSASEVRSAQLGGTTEALLVDLEAGAPQSLVDALRGWADRPPVVGLADEEVGARVHRALWKEVDVVVRRPYTDAVVAQAIRGAAQGEGTPGVWATGVMVGPSRSTSELREQIRRVSRFPDLNVLIEGETGTGKEVIARAIHRATAANRPFAAINAAAVPTELFESELFGHTTGAFTGAKGSRTGVLEEAADGSLFLDEIGDMPTALQPKLLRVLETRVYRPVGSSRDQAFRARVISATNRLQLVGWDSAFRSDLYFRLASFTIRTVPLRERWADIEPLALHFLRRFARRYEGLPRDISPSCLDLLMTYCWPGNVRELKSVVEQSAVLDEDHTSLRADTVQQVLRSRAELVAPLSEGAVPSLARPMDALPRGDLPEMERRMILRAYEEAGQNLSRAARILDLPRTTLRDRLKRYGAL